MMPEFITLISKIDFGLIIKIVTFSCCIVIYNFSINVNVLAEPTGTESKFQISQKRKENSFMGLYPNLFTCWLDRKIARC